MENPTNKEVMRWALKDWFYSKIRFLFVNDVNENEDFYCGECGEPVLRRILFCSLKCSQQNAEGEIGEQIENSRLLPLIEAIAEENQQLRDALENIRDVSAKQNSHPWNRIHDLSHNALTSSPVDKLLSGEEK